MVGLAIIAVLMGLLLAPLQKLREEAARTACRNNVKQIAIGMHRHHDDFQALPPSIEALSWNNYLPHHRLDDGVDNGYQYFIDPQSTATRWTVRASVMLPGIQSRFDYSIDSQSHIRESTNPDAGANQTLLCYNPIEFCYVTLLSRVPQDRVGLSIVQSQGLINQSSIPRLFDAVDVDGDGKVTHREIVSGNWFELARINAAGFNLNGLPGGDIADDATARSLLDTARQSLWSSLGFAFTGEADIFGATIEDVQKKPKLALEELAGYRPLC